MLAILSRSVTKVMYTLFSLLTAFLCHPPFDFAVCVSSTSPRPYFIRRLLARRRVAHHRTSERVPPSSATGAARTLRHCRILCELLN